MSKLKIETAQKFGRWQAVSRELTSYGKEGWLCICECGTRRVVDKYSLLRGNSKSCGCLNREQSLKRFTKHGQSDHPLNSVWSAMVGRCHREKHKMFGYYGARGISVCDEWRVDFTKFLDWSLANGWKTGLEIDRVDNDGNYEPSNCRFVDRSTNVNNRRRTAKTKTGYTGVVFSRVGNFATYISSNRPDVGQSRHLGTYHTLKEAVESRNKFIIDNNLPHQIQEYTE